MLREAADGQEWSDGINAIADKIESRLKEQLIVESDFHFTKLQNTVLSSEDWWEKWNDGENAPNLIIQGATSSGKTLLSEMSILDCLNRNRKALVVVPLKTMVRERSERFRLDMEAHGYRVYASSSDYLDYDAALINGDYDVGIMVYEKFFAMLNQEGANILRGCALLVIDEMTMLSQDERGPKLEMAIEIARIRNPDLRLVCLVTTDCDVSYVKEWLGRNAMTLRDGVDLEDVHIGTGRFIKVLTETSRPVGLDEYLVNIQDASYFKRHIPGENESLQEGDVILEERKEKLIPDVDKRVRVSADFDRKKSLLSSLLKYLQKLDENSSNGAAKILVFTNTQERTRRIANFLSGTEMFPSRDIPEEFRIAFERCDHDEDYHTLAQTISHGIAFHHSSISAPLRELIEREFQKKAGSCIQLIVATETMTVGINMPIDYIIMLDHEVPRGIGENVALTAQEYRNYIGRAGRLGLTNRCGKSYIFLPGEREIRIYKESINAHDQKIKSALTGVKESALAPFYLGLLLRRQGEANSFNGDNLRAFFDQSLAKACNAQRICDGNKILKSMYQAWLANRSDDDDDEQMQPDFDEEDQGEYIPNKRYALTDFGQTMALFALSVNTCLKIYSNFVHRKGRAKGGLPINATEEKINSDSYLLDILYLVCHHTEIQKSSNILIPSSRNPVERDKAIEAISRALWSLYPEWKGAEFLSQNSVEKPALPSMNLRYEAWENSRLNKISPEMARYDEHMRALLRALVMYYWTLGWNCTDIRQAFYYNRYSLRASNGDMERMSEIVSFHLEAVYRALRGDSRLKVAFNTLSRRVKYGVPQNLICIANRHVFGVERSRILEFGRYSQENGYSSPVECLGQASPSELERFFTAKQREEILERMDQRFMIAKSFTSILDAIQDDAGDFPERSCLQHIWDIGYQRINPPPFDELDNDLFDTLRRTGNVGFHFSERRKPGDNIWFLEYFDGPSSEARFSYLIGAYSEDSSKNAHLKEVFSKNPDKKRIILTFSDCLNEPYSEGIQYELAMTFECFARLLVHQYGDQKYSTEIAEFLFDLRGSFTKLPFNPRNYTKRNREPNAPYQILLNYSSADSEYQHMGILWQSIQNDEFLQTFYALPWGTALKTSYSNNLPTVILMTRNQVSQSESVSKFLYDCGGRRKEDCLVVFPNANESAKWSSPDRLEKYPEVNWMEDNCEMKLYPSASVTEVPEVEDLKERIRAFLNDWHSARRKNAPQPQFTIGVCYPRYNDSLKHPEWKTDVDCLKSVLDKLGEHIGRNRILFYEYEEKQHLFIGNPELSLQAYEECSFFLILWNEFTQGSEDCDREIKVIQRTVAENPTTKNYWYLRRTRKQDTMLPDGFFDAPLLSDDSAQQDELVKRIREELHRLGKLGETE